MEAGVLEELVEAGGDAGEVLLGVGAEDQVVDVDALAEGLELVGGEAGEALPDGVLHRQVEHRHEDPGRRVSSHDDLGEA